MSRKIAYIASMMKKAERLKEELLEILSKKKLEDWDYTAEDLQKAWEMVDTILMIDSEVSVGAALSRAVDRVELAVAVMDTRDEMSEIGLPYDDMSDTRSLELK